MKSLPLVALALLAGSDLCAQPAVLVFGDGRIEAHLDDGPLEPERLRGLDHAWVWSASSAPRRVAADDFGRQPPPEAEHRLLVRVASAGEPLPPGLVVLAAPAEMWSEVPEHLLPAWPVPETARLSLLRDPGRPWRLRLLGDGLGSWWQDVAAGQTSRVLEPVPAVDRVVEITDSDSQGLPRASLTLLSDNLRRHGVVAQHRADERGRVRVRSLPDDGELTLIVSEQHHAPAALTASPAGWPHQLQLAPGSSVHGRFVDPEGIPVPGVEVRAEAWISDRADATTARATKSDEQGSWSLEALPRGKAALAATATAFAPFHRRVDLTVEAVDLGSIELTPGHLLRVVVTDDAGAPVPAATVETAAGRTAITDRRGRARLADVGTDRAFELAARADGHLPVEVRVTPPVEEEVRLTLERAFRVEGRFVDQDGVGVIKGTARVAFEHRYFDHQLLPDGRFELDLEPGKTARLTLRSPTTRELIVTVEAGLGGESRDLGSLRAPAGVRIVGRMLRGDTAAPVAGATVWTPRPSDQGDVVAWAQGDLVTTSSNLDGSFELDGLPSRPMLLRVDAPGMARAHLSIDPDGGWVDVGDVFLSEGTRVLVLTGEEAVGAEARVDLRGGWLELDMLTATVTNDGQAVVGHVPPGAATVTVLRGRDLLCEQRIEISEGEDSLEVDCHRDRMRVSGTVTVGGEPAGPGQLHWLPDGAEGVPGLIMNRETPLGARQQRTFGGGRPQVDVEVDAAGRFSTDRLRPGSWRVSWLPEAGSVTAPETVELPEDLPEQAVRLAFGGLVLSGHVVDDEDRPIGGARVWVAGGAAFALTRSDGRFSLVDLDPGRHRLHARFEHLDSQVVEALVEPDQPPAPVRLVVSDTTPKKIEVRVLGDGDEPVPGAFVFLERDDRQTRMLTTDSEGRVWVALRPPEPAWVRFASISEGVWAFGPWLDLDQATDGVTHAPQDTGSIRIASPEQRGAAAIFSAEGWDLSWLLTRIGARPYLSPDLPLEIAGLPEGTYTLALGDFDTEIAVRRGGLTEIEIP